MLPWASPETARLSHWLAVYLPGHQCGSVAPNGNANNQEAQGV